MTRTEIRKLVRRMRKKYTEKTAGCADARLCCNEILKALGEKKHG